MILVLYGLSTLAFASAWMLTPRWPHYRLVGWVLGAGLGIDLARFAFRVGVLNAARAVGGGAPFAGNTRLLFHIDQALFLLWPFLLVAATWWRLARDRRAWGGAALAWCWTVVVVAGEYPLLRGARLGDAYTTIHALAVGAAGGAVVVFLVDRRWPLADEIVLLLWTMVEATLLVGPYFANPFTSWWTAQGAYAVFYWVVIALQARWLWKLWMQRSTLASPSSNALSSLSSSRVLSRSRSSRSR